MIIMEVMENTLGTLLKELSNEQFSTIKKQYKNIFNEKIDSLLDIISSEEDKQTLEQLKTIDMTSIDKINSIKGLLYHFLRLNGMPTDTDDLNISIQDDRNKRIYYLEKTIKTLDRLHSYDIYHGDAHLNNFMIKDDHIYVIDFGKSKIGITNNLRINDFELIKACIDILSIMVIVILHIFYL